MRTLFLLIFALMGFDLGAQVPTPAKKVNSLEFQEILAGWWDEGPAEELKQFCGSDRNLHRHVFAADGKTITWEFERPTKIFNGKDVKSFTYRVVNASSVVLTLFIENETRKNEKGEYATWELVVVGPGLFRWRGTDFPTGIYNPVWGRRCK